MPDVSHFQPDTATEGKETAAGRGQKRSRKPAGEKPKLTDSAITSAIKAYAVSDTRIELIDPGCEGLRIRPKKGGKVAVWSLLVRDQTGENRRFVIGEYPTIGIAKARELAGDTRHQVRRDGIDPNKIRQEKREAARQEEAPPAPVDPLSTFEGVINYYGEKQGSKRKTWEEAKKCIKRVFGAFYERDARTLDVAELQKAADDWEFQTSASTAVRYLKPVVRWAAKRKLCPFELFTIDQPQPVRKRGRFLTKDELKLLLPILKTYTTRKRRSMHAASMLFMLLTATRRSEAAESRWCEIYGDTWIIPAERVKHTRPDRPREPHTIPLSKQAQELLVSVKPAKFSQTDLIFPNRYGDPLAEWDRVTKGIRKKAGVYGWHRHDLRRTAATCMGQLGIAPHVIEAALNHAEIHSELAGTYNLARYTDEVGGAFQALADWLDGVEAEAKKSEQRES
jgi:integrase